jgi:hypothetical protein
MAVSKYKIGSVDSIADYTMGTGRNGGAPTPPPPPPPADTTIGTVTVAGSEAVSENAVTTYTVSHDGDADDLSYAWAIEGGTGTSATETCEVTWGSAGAGKVTCTITSTEDTVTDSPASGKLDVTISV